jgi:outer membrane protein OmpA-like peptidoglycan-associated protein
MPMQHLRWAQGAAAGLLVAVLAGCASKPVTQVVLLPQADGAPSAVRVQSGATPPQTLSTPYQRLAILANASLVLDHTSAEQVRKDFPSLFSSMPAPSALSVLLFQPGGTDLTSASQVRLAETRDEALRRRDAELVVIGHTDTVGSQAANDALSLRRAQQVRDMYIQGGFPAARIEAVGRGERELAVPTPDETSEPRNRRVEILLR